MIRQLIEALELQILPIDQAVIHRYAPIRVALEQKGLRLEDFDLLIAATAIAHKLTLITHNHKHFAAIPTLKVTPKPRPNPSYAIALEHRPASVQ